MTQVFVGPRRQLFRQLLPRHKQGGDASNFFSEPSSGAAQCRIGLMFIETDHEVATIHELRLLDKDLRDDA